MDKAKILPLPGNSSKEGNFYEQQSPAGPSANPDGSLGFGGLKPSKSVEKPPFKITGGR